MAESEGFTKAFEALKAGKYEQARALFDQHEASAGTAAETRRWLAEGDAALAAGDTQTAGARYDAVLDRNPSLPELYFGLARLALFSGEVSAATVHATAATRLAPKTGRAWTLLGLVHEAKGDGAKALELLEKGAALSPDDFLCQFNLGRVLADQGDFARGVAALDAATKLEKNNPAGFIALGVAYERAKQHAKAVTALEKATFVQPKSFDAWATLADVHFAHQDYKAARAALDAGLRACGDHPALLEKAVAVAMVQADTKGALGYVRRELEVVPDHEQAWLNLAGLLLLDKQVDASERAAQECLKRHPKSWSAHFHLGNLYEAVPKDAEAEAAYGKAIELAPAEWKPLANLGALLVQGTDADKHAEAVKLLEKASTLAPKDELRPRYNLALACARLGKIDKALEHARAVKKAAPPGSAMAVEGAKLEANLLEKKS